MNYINDPNFIGKYNSDSSMLVNNIERQFPFEKNIEVADRHVVSDIMEVKPRTTVPDLIQPVSGKVSKSCNLAGININRFENPHTNVQNPIHIIQDESFRGGVPSRIVVKDEYQSNMTQK